MKSIHEVVEGVKQGIAAKYSRPAYRDDVIIIVIIFMVGFAGFGLGRLSINSHTKAPVRITEPSIFAQGLSASVVSGVEERAVNLSPAGKYIASKTGSKYHFPWCAGARSISEKNKIWFDTKEAAEKAGYEPAGNCKGLK